MCPVSVVKTDSVQGGGVTNRVRREIKYSVATNGSFGKSICYLSVGLYVWKNDTAMSEK